MEIHGGVIPTFLTQNSMTRRRVVVFPLPFQGHINPMLQLASILHTKGFKIVVIHTQFNTPNYSNYPHFTFKSIHDGSYSKLRESTSLSQPIDFYLRYLNENCVVPFRDCLAGLLAEPGEELVVCLITDAIWYFAQDVADGLRLPRLVLSGTSRAFHGVFCSLPLLREKGLLNLTEQDSKYEAVLPDFEPIRVKDVIKSSKNPQSVSKSNLISTISKATKQAVGHIWNTFHELEQPVREKTNRQEFAPLNFMLPLHKYFPASSSTLLEQDRSIISWLDGKASNSLIYVSFGSMERISKFEFQEMAHGLAISTLPFLWVVRPGSVHGSGWLESLPKGFLEDIGDRGRIVKWAPQQEVLAHEATGCFLTHNGWNSTLESICEGVPMICSPGSGDQPINARYVSDVWKIGCLLENGLERAEIDRAIKRVMVDKEGEDMRKRINCLKQEVNLSIKDGGSSQQSLESLINYLLSL